MKSLTILFFIMFLLSLNPLTMMINLLMVSISGVISMSSSANPWLPMISIMVFSGGMMITFFYIVSTLPNPFMKIKQNKTPLVMLPVMLSLLFIDSMHPFNMSYQSLNYNLFLTKLFSMKSVMLPSMLMIILLMVMLIVSYIVLNQKTPFRKIKY